MPTIAHTAYDADRLSTRAEAARTSRTLSSAVLVGAGSGFLVGGVLGRLAMRLMTLTSPDELRGRITDDAAVVGDITLGGSIALALFTTFVGIVGGIGYLAARRALPHSRISRVLLFALLSMSVGGALLLHDHPSFDFSTLQPTWLAVALFLALPIVYGLLVAIGIEWSAQPDSWIQRLPLPLPVITAALISIPAIPLVLPACLLAFAIRLVPVLYRLWSSRLVTITAVVLYTLLVAWGLYGIAADVYSMATDKPSRAPFTV